MAGRRASEYTITDYACLVLAKLNSPNQLLKKVAAVKSRPNSNMVYVDLPRLTLHVTARRCWYVLH
jgi:hypothetical protein